MAKSIHRGAFCILILVAFTALPTLAWGQANYDIIAATGDSAPDANGTFSGFSDRPELNGLGQVGFHGELTGTSGGSDDDTGIFRGSGGALTQLVREGQAAPDGNGVFSSFSIHLFSHSGDMAFISSLSDTTGGTTDNHGVMLASDSGIIQIFREGQAAPDGNGEFADHNSIAVNTSGQVVSRINLRNTSGGLDDNDAIYTGTGTTPTLITREEHPAPDGNGTITSPGNPVLNASGLVVFHTYLADTSGGSTDNQCIFLGSGGVLTQIVRKGQPTPDGNGTFGFLYAPVLNSAGQAAFCADPSNTSGGTADDRGIFRGSGGEITQIVREGQLAPDGNGVFHTLDLYTALNASGQAAFLATISDTVSGSDEDGIFRGSGGTVTQIAREGQAAPDGNGVFNNFYDMALNASGQALFRAYLSNTGGGTADDRGIYLANGFDTLQIAREGQAFDGSTITDLDIADGTGSGNSTAGGLNDAAQVAFWVELADGREEIVRFTLPDLRWTNPGSGQWSTDGNWTQGTAPNSLYDVYITPDSGATVTGNDDNTYVETLTVGSTGSGEAVLVLAGGDLEALIGITINQRGRIKVSAGRVLTAPSLTNAGVLNGTGQVDAVLGNLSTGEVRVASGEHLRITGAGSHANAGRIEVIGGQIEFTSEIVNAVSTGLITGRDAILRFGGGLDNRGSIALAYGMSDLVGDVINRSTGVIALTGASSATFYDDVQNFGVIQVSAGSSAVYFGDVSGSGSFTGTGTNYFEGDMRPGNSPAKVELGGNVVFGTLAELEIELGGTLMGNEYDSLDIAGMATIDGTLEVLLIDEFVPTAGDSFEILSAANGLAGSFHTEQLPSLSEGLLWAVHYTSNSVLLAVHHGADFDEDGDVDGADFLAWQTGFGTQSGAGHEDGDANGDGVINAGDLTAWESQFGNIPASGSAAQAAVPEPAGFALLIGLVIGCLFLRMSKNS